MYLYYNYIYYNLYIFYCVSSAALKIEELQEALRKKEEEMKQMEERYKKYLEKAKSVSMNFVGISLYLLITFQ